MPLKLALHLIIRNDYSILVQLTLLGWFIVPSKQVNKTNLKESVEAIKKKFGIIGRTDELMKALAAKAAGRHILLEGPVGVGKTEIAHELIKIDSAS